MLPWSTAAFSFVNEVEFYTTFCNGAVLPLFLHALILCIMDCGTPSAEIPLRTYLSQM